MNNYGMTLKFLTEEFEMKMINKMVVFLFTIFLLIVVSGCTQGISKIEKDEIQGITMVSIPGGSFMMGHVYK